MSGNLSIGPISSGGDNSETIIRDLSCQQCKYQQKDHPKISRAIKQLLDSSHLRERPRTMLKRALTGDFEEIRRFLEEVPARVEDSSSEDSETSSSEETVFIKDKDSSSEDSSTATTVIIKDDEDSSSEDSSTATTVIMMEEDDYSRKKVSAGFEIDFVPMDDSVEAVEVNVSREKSESISEDSEFATRVLRVKKSFIDSRKVEVLTGECNKQIAELHRKIVRSRLVTVAVTIAMIVMIALLGGALPFIGPVAFVVGSIVILAAGLFAIYKVNFKKGMHLWEKRHYEEIKKVLAKVDFHEYVDEQKKELNEETYKKLYIDYLIATRQYKKIFPPPKKPTLEQRRVAIIST